MAQFLPLTGTILTIDWQYTNTEQMGCALNVSVLSQEQGTVNVIVSGCTYVLGSCPLNENDSVTFFYDANVPVPAIYPPQYQAVAAAHTSQGISAAMDTFTQALNSTQLTNSDDSLRLNISDSTNMMLPNGQPFGGNPSGKLLMVLYSATTRSLPPQTSPELIVVFCQ